MATAAAPPIDLVWCFPEPGQNAFDLRAGSASVGRLIFNRQPQGRSFAEYDGRRWTLDLHGGHHPHVEIRAADSEEIVATYVPNLTGGGSVSFASGARYCWTRQSIWSARWCFRCKQNQSAVCVSQEAERLMDGGKVHICPDAAALPEASLLVLLAWYLRILAFEKLEETITLCD